MITIYLGDNNKFDKSLINAWSNEIKPYIEKTFPVTKKGKYQTNSDLESIFVIIDKFKEKYIEEEKNANLNTIIKSNLIEDKKGKGSKAQNDIITKKDMKKNSNDIEIKTNKKVKAYEEEDIKILRMKNMAKISNFLIGFIKQNDLEKKRTNSMFNLRPHSKTISSETTCDDSVCMEDSNLIANQLIENNIRTKSINYFDDFYKKNIIEEETKEKKEKRKTLKGVNTISSLNEMLPKYKEEDESIDHNIKYQESNNELSFISIDLLLKKIIFEDFLNNNILLIYHFCQQCFCFVSKEIFFKKIIDCYHYYKNAKLGLDKLKNLIDFINILVVELCQYYETINNKEVYVKVIQNFYYELINDILINYDESENIIIKNNDIKGNNINNNNIKTINDYNIKINRKNLIKMSLKAEINNKATLLLTKKAQEEYIKTNKEILQSNADDNDSDSDNKNKHLFEDFMEDKKQIINDNNKNKFNKRKTLNFHEKSILSLSKPEKNEKNHLALNNENQKKENNIGMENLRISTKPNNSIMKNDNKSFKFKNVKRINEEKSDEDEKNNELGKSKNIFSWDDENIIEQIQETQDERNNVINNLVDEVFNGDKIISQKDEMLKIIRCILYLIDIKSDQDFPSISEIRDIKEKISFYKSVDELNKKKAKKLISNRKKRYSSYSTFSSSVYISLKQQTMKKEYLGKGYFCVTDWETEEIGDKITEVTKSFLNKIHPREIYGGIFTKKEKEKTSPNVCLCIKSFNRLSSFIIEDVLSFIGLKKRLEVFDKWVEIADYLKNKKNYNDCLAVYLTLNNSTLDFVKKGLKTKTKNKFEQLGIFCTCLGNYKNIKEDMKQCEKTGEIFIPYLGLLLKEILTLNENSKYSRYIENGCVNMEKIEKTNETIEKYFKYKTGKNYSNKKSEKLDFFYHLEDISEEDLYKIKGKKGTILYNKKLTNIDMKYFLQYLTNSKKRQTITSSSEFMNNAHI